MNVIIIPIMVDILRWTFLKLTFVRFYNFTNN